MAHAVLRSVDTGAARALPGVHAVITAAEIGDVPRIPLRQEPSAVLQQFEQPVIATGKVRYVGEPIAVVVADTGAIAEDALDLIALDLAALPVVANREAAARDETLLFDPAGTNLASTLTAIRGDIDAAFAGAPYTRRDRFRVHRHTAMPMECRGLLADWQDGRLTLSGVTKVTFANRRVLAETTRRAGRRDRHGGERCRRRLRRARRVLPGRFPDPVRRPPGGPPGEVDRGSPRAPVVDQPRPRRGMRAGDRLHAAMARSSACAAMRGPISAPTSAPTAPAPLRNVVQVMSGPYSIPNIRIDGDLLVTNKTPVGTYRGPGRFEADFFRERLFDMVAQDLGIDRVAFRRRNLVTEAQMPYPLATVLPYNIATSCDSGDYSQTLDRCLAEIGWDDKAASNGRLVDGRHHGLGIGCYLEGGASGPRENARLALDVDGRVSIYVGSSAIGQGLETVFAQIAADALELPMDRIAGVFHGSTSIIHEGFGSFSSRSTVLGGSAILDAAAKLLEAIRSAAAARLGCDAADTTIDAERVLGPTGSVGLADLAPISVDGTFASNKRTYSYGCHAAHVAVDPNTGHVAVLDYVAVEDVGRIINPMALHGQATGAIVQGLGGVFLEHLVYDDSGQLLTGSLADYLVPTASDFPRVRAVTLELRPSLTNPLGAKGAGEGGIVAVAAAVGNALAAALGPLGVQPRELPLSPGAVWQLVQGAA